MPPAKAGAHMAVLTAAGMMFVVLVSMPMHQKFLFARYHRIDSPRAIYDISGERYI